MEELIHGHAYNLGFRDGRVKGVKDLAADLVIPDEFSTNTMSQKAYKKGYNDGYNDGISWRILVKIPTTNKKIE